MSSSDELIPITREFLRENYKKYPDATPSSSLETARGQLEEKCIDLGVVLEKGSSDDSGFLADRVIIEAPHKIDENVWRSRQQCEELMHFLCEDRRGVFFGDAGAPVSSQEDSSAKGKKGKRRLRQRMKKKKKKHSDDSAKDGSSVSVSVTEETEGLYDVICNLYAKSEEMFETLKSYQEGTMGKVNDLIQTFLPNDFRIKMVQYKRQRTEAANNKAIDDLVARGGTIQEKYDLYWKQQMDRREVLVSIGNAAGAYKMILQYIGGVPQVLLDFIQTINTPGGPMEELRLKYGPMAYYLTETINRCHVFLAAIVHHLENKGTHQEALLSPGALQAELEVLSHAMEELSKAYDEYLTLMLKIFMESPFFITKEQAMMASGGGSEAEFTTQVVSKVHRHRVRSAPANVVAWEFSTNKNNINFKVSFHPGKDGEEEGDEQEVFPLTRVDSHVSAIKGTHTSEHHGTYTFEWDNSFSYFSKKTVKYRVHVAEEPSEMDEEGLESALNDIMEEEQEEVTRE